MYTLYLTLLYVNHISRKLEDKIKENLIWDPELPKLASGADPNHFLSFSPQSEPDVT